jgi:hypothetical protein
MPVKQQFFYDKQIRRYIQQFIRLFSGFSVQMGHSDDKLPIFHSVPVRYGDINRMAAHIQRENSENMTNTVPFISCYVNNVDMAPERRQYQGNVEKVQVFEKKYDESSQEYLNEVGNRYTIERHQPVPYFMDMNCDIWTSNTDQKLQLLEQIMVLFNPTLNIRTTNNPFDWTSLSYVEMTNTTWSSRSVGSTIDDMIDVATLTFRMPILITPPAKVKQQKLIYNIISELYSLDDENLDSFKRKDSFDKTTLQYTIVTFEDRKLKFDNNNASLLNKNGSKLNDSGNTLDWSEELRPFGELREGISQIRLRKSSDPSDKANDIIGRIEFDPNDVNLLKVTVDTATLPTNTLSNIDGILNPSASFPGDGNVPAAALGQRYLITNATPINTNWTNVVANKNDIVEYNGTAWVVSFDSQNNNNQQYVLNNATLDQFEWNGTEWFNAFEGIYKPGFWRLYL